MSAQIVVTFKAGGVAEVVGPHGNRYAGTYSERHGVWAPGSRRSHTVGVHSGRLAVVQHGIDTMSLGHLDAEGVWTSDRKGRGDANGPGWWWRGLNIHDRRGPLLGCVGLSSRDMLDLLGEVQLWTETAKPLGRHRDTGWPILTVEVIHALG